MIHVVAELPIAPGARERFVEEFRRIVGPTRAEEGCVEYVAALEIAAAVPGTAAPRPDVLTVIEKWTSEAALAAHLAAPHMATFRENTRELSTGATIRVLREI